MPMLSSPSISQKMLPSSDDLILNQRGNHVSESHIAHVEVVQVTCSTHTRTPCFDDPREPKMATTQAGQPIGKPLSTGCYVSKHDNGHQYSRLKLNTGLDVELTNSPDGETLEYIESAIGSPLEQARLPSPPHKKHPKLVIGEGGQGKVRIGILAECTHGTKPTPHAQPIAVKKVVTQKQSFREIENAENCHSEYLPHFYGWTKRELKNGQSKFYLAYEYIHGETGLAHLNTVAQTLNESICAFEMELLHTASEYANAITSLHQHGIYHSDIKPENFLHETTGRIYLCDLGLAHSDILIKKGGTAQYFPPEVGTENYRADAHDAFALGLTLLSIIEGGIKNMGQRIDIESSKQRSGQRAGFVMWDIAPMNRQKFSGLYGTSSLQINHTIDVIIRLLDRDPESRMTVEAASQELQRLRARVEPPMY